MAGQERVLVMPAGLLVVPAYAPKPSTGRQGHAPDLRTAQAPVRESLPSVGRTQETEGGVTQPMEEDHSSTIAPQTTWTLPRALPGRKRGGQCRVIALVEASPAGTELLAAAVAREGFASGRTTVALSLEPRSRLFHLITEATNGLGLSEGLVTIASPPEALLTQSLLTERLTLLQAHADLLVIDLGCRWAPGQFRPVLTVADEIWLVGKVGEWGALEVRQSQAEFSGWTNLDRIQLFALGPVVPGGRSQPDGAVVLLEADLEHLTLFAQSYWRRQHQ